MRVIHQFHPTLNECLVGIRFDGAGSVWDPFPGAHHLLEHLISRQIQDVITALGGRYDAFTYREYQTHSFALPPDRIKEALESFSQAVHAVCECRWTADDQVKVIHILKQERKLHRRNPHERLLEALDHAVLCETYARPTSHIEPPNPLQHKQLADLARTAFHDNRATMICLSPNERAHSSIVRHIDLPYTREETRLTFPKCPRKTTTIETDRLAEEEAFIRFDFPGFGVTSDLCAFNRVASAFLVGMNGSLNRILDETGGGWCYDLFSDTAQFALFAQVNCGAACAPYDIEQTHRSILQTVEHLARDPLGDAQRWQRLKDETKKDVERLRNDPYELFEFLLEEAHPLYCGELVPELLLGPWSIEKRTAEYALRSIFNPNTISIAKTNHQRRARHTLVSRGDEP